MTPAERQLVTDLFDRLATLEDAPRDPDAERAIRDGLAQAPNAVYALVQTALVQDEALKSANARIEELEAELGAAIRRSARAASSTTCATASSAGRTTIWRQNAARCRTCGRAMRRWARRRDLAGRPDATRPVSGPADGRSGLRPPQARCLRRSRGRRGGSFLGTAAAAAAGVIGGSMLMNSIRGMTGGGGPAKRLPTPAHGGGGSPWGSSGGGGGGDLARQAGIDDIGRSSGPGRSAEPGHAQRQRQRQGRRHRHLWQRQFEDDNFDDDDADFDDGGDVDSGSDE